jgi:hypothetical protein
MDEELMSVPVPLGAEPPALHHEDDVHDGHVTHVGDDAQKKADGVVVGASFECADVFVCMRMSQSVSNGCVSIPLCD